MTGTCQTLRVFGLLMQIRVFILCCFQSLPLERSTISVRNLKVSLLARDTPAPIQLVQVSPHVLAPLAIDDHRRYTKRAC
jgi:hypothetical protein